MELKERLKMGVRVFALIFIFGNLAIAADTAWAQRTKEVKFKEYPFEIAKGERLVFQGVRGQVKLIAGAPGQPVVVRAKKIVSEPEKAGSYSRFDSLSFSVRREGGVVIVEPRGPMTRQEWIDWSRPGQPELVVEIQCPQVAAEIHLHSGIVSAVGWTDSLAISLQDGKISLSGGKGAVRATILRGDIRLEKQIGNIEIENHNGKVAVVNSEGALVVHSFSGETAIAGLKGDVSYRAKSGTANISNLVGGFRFENGRGRIEGTAVDGTVRGRTDEGAVNLQLAGESDVSIETVDGAVSIKPPAGSGALLKLSTEEGAIVAPDSVSVPKVSGAKSVVARLSGGAKGTIVVRSKKGTIRVR